MEIAHIDNIDDEEQVVSEQENAGPRLGWPVWLLVLGSFTVLAMATQGAIVQRLPITTADPLLALTLAGTFLVMWRRGVRLPAAWPVLLFLVLCFLAALGAGSGRPGAIEAIQRAEQFLGAYLLFQLLFDHRPAWLVKLVGAGLIMNVLFALYQVRLEGFGPQITGLFRSRTSLDFFLTIALAWCLPFWLSSARGLWRVLAVVIVPTLALAVMANGQLLLAAVFVMIVTSLCHSRRGFVLISGSILLFLLSLWATPGGAGRRTILSETLSPFHGDRLKQCHTELVAAVRMGAEHPWTGIGLGRYQQWIGTFYRELYNPNENQIETDTQSGYGILFGTGGMLVGALFVLVLLAAAGRGLRNWFNARGLGDPAALAGAVGILAVLTGMWVSDPLVRGVGWYVVLALAAANRPGIVDKHPVGPMLGWKSLVAWGLIFAVLAGGILMRGHQSTSIAAGGPVTLVPPAPPAPASPGATPAPGPATGNTAAAETFTPDPNFFRVIDAGDAREFSAPVIKGTDPKAAKGTILRIPDETGKPPEGVDPGMKYGGIRFDVEIPRNMTCAVWMRVFWEGACGNSVYYRHPDGTTLAVGNDGTYDVWHWLNIPQTFHFKKGSNTFYVLDREDGVRLDQIVITGDLEYVPQGIEEE